jgi:hypothetical protein
MSGLVSAAAHHSGQEVALPAGVEELLVDVAADGFTLYCCGLKSAPNALVACYEWDHYACVDLLTFRDFDRVITARVPTLGTVDIFAPEVVIWAYEGPPQPALRALLNLVHPAHPDAPTLGYPAPPALHVPRAQQRPMTIQPPSPRRAGVRAARLAAAVPTHSADRAGSDEAPGVTPGPEIAGWSSVEPRGPRRWAPGGQPATKP